MDSALACRFSRVGRRSRHALMLFVLASLGLRQNFQQIPQFLLHLDRIFDGLSNL